MNTSSVWQLAGLDNDQLRGAAAAAEDTYHPERDRLFSKTRLVRQFWPVGDLIAATRIDKETDTVFIAVRGTSEFGNWIFTNLQAFYTKLYVVDDSLGESNITFQGGKLANPISGRMHQGFIRAFSWLWYGSEPMLGPVGFNSRAALQQLIKYLLIFFVPLLIWWTMLWLEWTSVTLSFAAPAALLFAFALICLETGTVEGLFLRPAPPTGQPLCKLLDEINSHRTVVFTGHSLGGAIASVFFAVYRAWCRSDAKRLDNGHLVTFGSARLGDEEFIQSFEHLHGTRIIHFEHPGDPVPQIPPNGLWELLYRRYPIRGVGGLLIGIAFFPWTAYKYLYRVSRPARWSPQYVCNMGEGPYRRLCFSFHSMTQVYTKFVNTPPDERLRRSSLTDKDRSCEATI